MSILSQRSIPSCVSCTVCLWAAHLPHMYYRLLGYSHSLHCWADGELCLLDSVVIANFMGMCNTLQCISYLEPCICYTWGDRRTIVAYVVIGQNCSAMCTNRVAIEKHSWTNGAKHCAFQETCSAGHVPPSLEQSERFWDEVCSLVVELMFEQKFWRHLLTTTAFFASNSNYVYLDELSVNNIM